MLLAVIVITIIYACLPLPLKGIVMVINFLVPDSIPIIDELAMGIGFLLALSKD